MTTTTQENKIFEIPATIPVRELAELLDMNPLELLKALISNGIMATITQSIDYETAALVAEDLGFTLYLEGQREREEAEALEEARLEAELEALKKRKRKPA